VTAEDFSQGKERHQDGCMTECHKLPDANVSQILDTVYDRH